MKGHLVSLRHWVARLRPSLNDEWLTAMSPSPGLHPHGPGMAPEGSDRTHMAQRKLEVWKVPLQRIAQESAGKHPYHCDPGGWGRMQQILGQETVDWTKWIHTQMLHPLTSPPRTAKDRSTTICALENSVFFGTCMLENLYGNDLLILCLSKATLNTEAETWTLV